LNLVYQAFAKDRGLDEGTLVNEYFETIEELEEKLVQRCCVLENMTEEIKNLTNYHWLTYS
jgi:hypothetical protein